MEFNDQYQQLNDKNIDLKEKLNIAHNIWSTNKYNVLNKDQLVVDWVGNLISNKRNAAYDDNETILIWQTLNQIVHDEKFSNSSKITLQSSLIQGLIDAFNSPAKKEALKCCSKLFQTKFSVLIIRNFDYFTKILNVYITDEDKFNDLSLLVSILNNYFNFLKSQSNPTKLFNRLCTQILLNLLNLLTELEAKGNSKEINQLQELVLNLIRTAFFSKLYANSYLEFFKNLPNSFSNRTNYQVSVLFTTVQSATDGNFKLICKWVHLLLKEMLQILNCEYKLKVQIIQFLAELIWANNNETNTNHVYEALNNIFELVNELSIYSQVNDNNNEQVMSNWLNSFIEKTLNNENNANYVDYLIKLLKLNHLILDPYFEKILGNLKGQQLTAFLNSYLDMHVNVRQFSRLTHKLIENIKNMENKNVQGLPNEFYKHYEDCLENYHVDIQTQVHLWNDLYTLLKDNIKNKTKLSIELSKFINCILSRISLYGSSIIIKTQAIKLLHDTKSLLMEQLKEFNMNDDIYVYLLDNLFTCGFLYLILYRYSHTISNTVAIMSLDEVNEFIRQMNDELNLKNLSKKALSSKSYTTVFHLNKLNLFNVYAIHSLPVSNENTSASLKSSLNSLLNVAVPLIELTSVDISKLNKKNINSSNEYSLLHWKLIIFDNLHIIWQLIPEDERKSCCQKLIQFLLLKKNFSNDEFWKMDKINLDLLFNNKVNLKEIFEALLYTLNDQSLNATQNGSSKRKAEDENLFLSLVDFLKDDEMKSHEFKKLLKSKFTLNEKQIETFTDILSYVPIDYLDEKYSFICFQINEFAFLNDDCLNDKKDKRKDILRILYKTYPTCINILTPKNVEILLFKLYDFNSKLGIEEKNNKDFENFIRVTFNYLIRENNYDQFSKLLEKLFNHSQAVLDATSNQEMNIETDVNQFKWINFTFIQILDRICKTQEHRLGENETYNTGLKNDFLKIMKHFINLSQNESLLIESFNEKYNFLICSILIRRFCSKTIDKVLNDELTQYFQQLFNASFKIHKKLLKKHGCLTDSHIDFLKYYSINASKLTEYGIELKNVKTSKSLYNYILSIDENSMKINKEYYLKLCKTLSICINSMDIESFKDMLCTFDDTVLQYDSKNDSLLKVMKILEILSSDVDIAESLKDEFTIYIQKILVKIKPLLQNLREHNFDLLIELLDIQHNIHSSRHFILPSHIIVTSLQTYYLFLFENLNEKHFFAIQSIVSKEINNIICRYSNKFHRIAAIISALLTRLISATITFADQSNIKNENHDIVLKGAQSLERCITQLVDFKKSFSKLMPYMIAEYVTKASTIAIHPDIKISLTSAMYHLISMCDIHSISQLHVVLPAGPKDLFKILYSEYEKYFKYTGKI